MISKRDFLWTQTSPACAIEQIWRRGETLGRAVAYLMFTSGSTGTPKAVPIRHRQAVPAVEWWRTTMGYDEQCRAAQNAELTFDASITEIFPAWSAGGTLVVPRRQEVLAPVPFVRREAITHWFSVPPVAELPARSGMLTPGCLPSLRTVAFGADRLFAHQARAWAEAAPQADLFHSYGPTEVAIVCAGLRIGGQGDLTAAAANGTFPIGAVPGHLDHVVLGDDGQPAVTGELCVRGSQRFDGYLDPAGNAGCFLTWNPGERATVHDRPEPPGPEAYYRTGDTVTTEHGRLVFCGRRDGQTKIRGHRVEVAEVEAAILRHPGVHEAVVVARGSGSDAHLVAFHTGEAVPARELIGFVRTQLPLFMLPSRFTHRPTLPMTDNGKIDRRALATPEP